MINKIVVETYGKGPIDFYSAGGLKVITNQEGDLEIFSSTEFSAPMARTTKTGFMGLFGSITEELIEKYVALILIGSFSTRNWIYWKEQE